jgi:ubiquinone biosynthesis protein UbiJ
MHLADQSRRIDETNKRIDETNKRIDVVRGELGHGIDKVREELGSKITETNKRLDRLYEVIVRRDEHAGVERRVAALEQDMAEIKRRLAA